MRLLLHLKPLSQQPELMWNYHYPLSSWLYSVISRADEKYAAFLHDKGYRVDSGKVFKHFTFSDLRAKINFRKGEPGFRVMSPMVQWMVSFYVDKAAESFIIGLFQDQKIRLFNKIYDTTLAVERVEVLPEPDFQVATRFKAVSAMVIAEKVDGKDQYLAPDDPGFGFYLLSGLKDKYRSIFQENEIESGLADADITFKLIDASKAKSRKITIKEDKREATQVKGYRDFEFELTGPKEILEVGFYGGFGKECAQGFGFCEVG